MMAKSFILAKTFYRYSVLTIRDHGNPIAGYPSGVYKDEKNPDFPASPTRGLPACGSAVIRELPQ